MSNLVAEIAKEFRSGNTDDVVDIVTFVESPWGLNVKLLPVQKVILKAFYGLELDSGVNRSIEVPDVTNERILYRFNERDFLKWLYEEGRCNTNETQGLIFQELVLAIGRRGSKSSMAAFISNYELYKLVKRGDPAKYYGFPAGTQVAILTVAPTDDQSSIVFEMIQRMAMQCPYLKDRSLHQTMSYFDLRSDADMRLTGKPKASILSLTGGCSSNSLRGRNAIVVIMDEMAHFIDNQGRFSGSEVYKALTPSIADFDRDGKVICISSPYAKYGAFYDRFVESRQEKDITLMFKMYSAMVNPGIPMEILRAARRRNRVSFMCEYGGEFSDAVTAWVEDEQEFRRCVTARPAPVRGDKESQYFMGLDLGFKNDGTAICVVHRDKRTGKIVLDYANVWFSASSDVWEVENSIYSKCTKYAELELLRMADIVKEVQELVKWFPIRRGLFDQSNGYALAELLHAKNLKQFEMKQVTDKFNHELYQVTKTLYAEQLLDIFDCPVLVGEVLTLEAEKMAGSKVLVRAPNRVGAHDDMCLTPESLIVTKNGVKRIDDCAVGESVLTHKGLFRAVEAVSKRSVDEDIVEIRSVHLGTMRLTGNHPVYVLRDGIKQFVPASLVTRKDKMIYSFDMGVRSPNDLDLIDFVERRTGKENNAGINCSDLVVEEDWIRFANPSSAPLLRKVAVTGGLCRLFGYYVAEGSMGNHGISFAFAADEVEYHEDVKRLMYECFGIDKVTEVLSEPGTSVMLAFNSFILKDVFGKLFGRGAGHKRVPSWMMEMPFDLQGEFLKGVWRGDGCYTNRSFVFTTTSVVLVYQIRDMLLRLGVGAGIHLSCRKGMQHRFRGDRFYTMNYDLFNIRVQSLFDMVRIAEILDEAIPAEDLKRCRNTSERMIRFGELYCGIRNIKKVRYCGEVFNLTVPTDSSYVTSCGTVHNSDALVRAVWICYTQNKDRPIAIATGAGGGAVGLATPRREVPGLTLARKETQMTFLMRKRKMHGEHPRGLDDIKKRHMSSGMVRA